MAKKISNFLAKNLEFKIAEEWKDFLKENPDAQFIPETAKDSSGRIFVRRKQNPFQIYELKEIRDKEMHLSCAYCGKDLAAEIVRNPPTAKAPKYEFVPYCPNCEQPPSKQNYKNRCF